MREVVTAFSAPRASSVLGDTVVAPLNRGHRLRESRAGKPAALGGQGEGEGEGVGMGVGEGEGEGEGEVSEHHVVG